MEGYRLSLLGQPAIEGPTGQIRLTAVKAQALLWYLATQPDRHFSRSHIGALLWDEVSEADARNNLSTTMSRLRQVLPFDPLQTVGDRLGWAPLVPVAVDLHRFLGLIAKQADMSALAEAAGLWRGPFLEDFYVPACEPFDRWLQQERANLEHRILDALSTLLAHEEAHGRWDAMVNYARQAVAIDPTAFPGWFRLCARNLNTGSAKVTLIMSGK